jgi:uncharacterized protein YndB with AHSA1/START domain
MTEKLIVQRSVVVETDAERAFRVFTGRIGGWWPPAYRIGKAEFETAVIEPFAGGRWFERDVDGSECDWGRVLVWEPPHRLILAWQITAEWTFDPDFVTEIEVRFGAAGPRRTVVELEHRDFERFGDAARKMHQIFSSGGVPGAPQGWAGLLRAYAALI